MFIDKCVCDSLSSLLIHVATAKHVSSRSYRLTADYNKSILLHKPNNSISIRIFSFIFMQCCLLELSRLQLQAPEEQEADILQKKKKKDHKLP